jgi:ATPase subunit of ABC transporter with duplicated ATPase domains
VGGLEAIVGPLSGGERRRLALAGLLAADYDLLLLDEPTNHLDVEGVAWLADHLATRRTRPGTAVVTVTHDRWFLDEVATTTWEVVDGGVSSYDGGYAAYVLAKAERDRVAEVTEERRSNLLRKELAWLRRGAQARSTKPKFRIDAAYELIADEPAARDDVSLMRFATTRLGKDVVDLVDATVSFGARRLLDRVTWRLAPGDRIGIVGVNGSGKSTLMRAVFGDLALSAGRRKVGKTVSMAYLTQEVRELEKFASWRVIEAIEDVKQFTRLGDKEVSASQLAKRLGFSGGRQQTRVSDLSGGERRRLQFLRLLMAEPNVLILDEPTNDLDIETLTSMEDVLDGWAGTLLVVSHDRYLLERMCDRQVAMLGDGAVRDLPGGVEQYLDLRRTARASAAAAAAAPSAGTRVSASSSSGAGSRAGSGSGASASRQSAADLRGAKKDLSRIDRQLAKLAAREDRIHVEMAAKAADHTAVLALNNTLRAILDERETLELEWLSVAELIG